MSSHQQKPVLSCVRVSRLTTLFATPACVVVTWLRCRALAALGIWVCSLRGRWDSILSRSDAGREKEKLAKDLGAHVYIDTTSEDATAVLTAYGRGQSDSRNRNQW